MSSRERPAGDDSVAFADLILHGPLGIGKSRKKSEQEVPMLFISEFPHGGCAINNIGIQLWVEIGIMPVQTLVKQTADDGLIRFAHIVLLSVDHAIQERTGLPPVCREMRFLGLVSYTRLSKGISRLVSDAGHSSSD